MSIGGCDDSAADEAGRYAPASSLSNENFNKKNEISLFVFIFTSACPGLQWKNLKYVFK